MNISDYAGCSDEELISLSRSGEDGALDFLIARYVGLVRQKAFRYFLVGADKEDLVGVFSLHKIRLFIKPVPNRPVRMELLPNSGRRVPRLLSYYFMEVDLSELQICIPFL